MSLPESGQRDDVNLPVLLAAPCSAVVDFAPRNFLL
jgi:hypothetical protein